MNEEWKIIKEYPDYYISNLGNVKSCRTQKPRILTTTVTPQGYCVVTLSTTKNKHITKSVHRLVAEAFIPNPYNFKCINHKDQNGSNNRVDNLEWCTEKYNCNYLDRNEKLSKSKKGVSINAGCNNPMYGKHRSKETKCKISEKLKGKFIGENNPMHGKHHSIESRLKMSMVKMQKRKLKEESENGKDQ